jgi:diguanylate cyclase (GGDEF)-like protein/PAS domain S-box-containing protein
VINSDGWSIVVLTPTDRIRLYKWIGILATISVCVLIMVFLGIIYVTDRSREAIRQSEESKSLLLHAAGEGIFGVDAIGQVTFVNPAALRMLGFSEEDMLGQRAHDLIHHSKKDGSIYPVEDCPMYASYTKAAHRNVIDEVLWRKDGGNFTVEYSSTPITEDGKITGAVVTFKDITDRKFTEEALRESESRMRAITDSAQDAILMMNPEGFISYWNPAAERILGYTSVEVISQNLHALIVPTHYHEAHHAAFPLFQQSGQGAAVGKTLDLEARRKDGEKISVQLSLSAVQMKGAWHAVGILRDITERKRMEAEILSLSITDQLTGLYNRRGFLALAEQQLKLAERNKSGMVLFFTDLDGLKWINDTLGHEEGDKALIEAATVLKETFRASDIIARLGGDEYSVLTIDITEENTKAFTARLQSLIDTRNNQENRRYRLSISVGCSYYDPEHPCSIDDLMASADELMYEQKRNKKGTLP